jgi:hypothetical protein
MNGRWRGLLARAMTLSGLARRGFFIPYRYAAKVAGAGTRPPYRAVEALFQSREDAFRAFLATIDGFAPELERIGTEAAPAPRWTQDWFPRLDAAAAYALVRSMRPRRVVEVGAGHSTRFVVRAIRAGGHDPTVTTIDPAPRADLSGLPVTVVRSTVQDAGEGVFADLKGGDVLMIDSSHVLVPGSDVDLLLNRVLPSLPGGAVVQVHDVFLPDDYPEDWAWRGYNEQLGVAALLSGGAFEVLFSSRYAATRMAAAVAATVVGRLPLVQGAVESSLWLRKTA